VTAAGSSDGGNRGDGGDGGAPLTLREAAEQLGVHYMTAYRYVRTGQLPASRRSGRVLVARADLAAFERRRTDAPGPARRPRSPRRPQGLHFDRLLDRLLAGDERGAWQVVDTALVSQTTPEAAHLDLLAPCMAEVGRRWQAGTLTVGQEHIASATAARIAARLAPLCTPRGPRRGAIVVGGPPGEHHTLPATLLTNVLRARAWHVIELGGDTPAADFVDAARTADRLTAVAVSVGSEVTHPAARTVIAALRAKLSDLPEHSDLPVLAGGPGIPDLPTARALGATTWAPTAAALADLLPTLRPRKDGI
jgi:excisionase family DNA binding protein